MGGAGPGRDTPGSRNRSPLSPSHSFPVSFPPDDADNPGDLVLIVSNTSGAVWLREMERRTARHSVHGEAAPRGRARPSRVSVSGPLQFLADSDRPPRSGSWGPEEARQVMLQRANAQEQPQSGSWQEGKQPSTDRTPLRGKGPRPQLLSRAVKRMLGVKGPAQIASNDGADSGTDRSAHGKAAATGGGTELNRDETESSPPTAQVRPSLGEFAFQEEPAGTGSARGGAGWPQAGSASLAGKLHRHSMSEAWAQRAKAARSMDGFCEADWDEDGDDERDAAALGPGDGAVDTGFLFGRMWAGSSASPGGFKMMGRGTVAASPTLSLGTASNFSGTSSPLYFATSPPSQPRSRHLPGHSRSTSSFTGMAVPEGGEDDPSLPPPVQRSNSGKSSESSGSSRGAAFLRAFSDSGAGILAFGSPINKADLAPAVAYEAQPDAAVEDSLWRLEAEGAVCLQAEPDGSAGAPGERRGSLVEQSAAMKSGKVAGAGTPATPRSLRQSRLGSNSSGGDKSWNVDPCLEREARERMQEDLHVSQLQSSASAGTAGLVPGAPAATGLGVRPNSDLANDSSEADLLAREPQAIGSEAQSSSAELSRQGSLGGRGDALPEKCAGAGEEADNGREGSSRGTERQASEPGEEGAAPLLGTIGRDSEGSSSAKTYIDKDGIEWHKRGPLTEDAALHFTTELEPLPAIVDRYGFVVHETVPEGRAWAGADAEREEGGAASAKGKGAAAASLAAAVGPLSKLERRILLREEREVQKWRNMIGVGTLDFNLYIAKRPREVKRRIRRGVPDCLRGLVWQLLSGSRELLIMNQGAYEHMLLYELSNSEMDIIRDIDRTYPLHVFYKQKHGPGQRSLFNVLKAYSVYDKKIGYVQGMGFLAGLMLLYMAEQDAFWLLVALTKGAAHEPLEGLFLVGLPLVQQFLFQFDRLLHEQLPRLAQHMDAEGVQPSMYASQWFITVFAYNFPFATTVRIWDVFLFEGIKTVFRVGLAILKQQQDQLVEMPFEELVPALRTYPEHILEADTLLSVAFSFKVSNRLHELHVEYKAMLEPSPQLVGPSSARAEGAGDGGAEHEGKGRDPEWGAEEPEAIAGGRGAAPRVAPVSESDVSKGRDQTGVHEDNAEPP